jgi:hypothetical protein
MWFALVVIVIAAVASYAMSPRAPEPPPVSIKEVSEVPTAEAGRAIPVVFGTCIIKSANIVWYGDLKYSPVKKKLDGGK